MLSKKAGLWLGAFAIFLFAMGNASAQADYAISSVEAAVAACAAKGYKVTATIVNKDGQLVAVFRGDGAAPHTLDSSRQKAYTAASFSAIVNMDKTSEIAERILS